MYWPTYYTGIDPGKNGGIVSLEGDLVHCSRLSDPLSDIASEFDAVGVFIVYLEKVHAMPGQGVTSMFNFGRSYGQIEGILAALNIKHTEIQPQAWQKHFDLLRRPGESKADKKNRHKALAKEMFPDVDVFHWNADALLIAAYCRDKEKT